MSKVYIVSRGFDYEGAAPIRVFSQREAADALVKSCEVYDRQRPSFLTSEEIEAWRKMHPAGPFNRADYYEVTELELIP